MKLLGGFLSTFLGFMMPGKNIKLEILGLVYVKSNDYPIYHWKNIMTLTLVLIFATIGFSAGTLTLIAMFK